MPNSNCPGFGVCWEAVPGPVGDNCRICAIKDTCLAEFATTTLPATQQRWPGSGGSQYAWVAKELDLAEQAILLAMAYLEKPKKPKQTPVKAEKASKPEATKPKASPIKPAKSAKKKKKAGGRWGDPKARWASERERNPEIAQLTPGTQIHAKFKGEVVEAAVRKTGYEYQEQIFPTLSTLTKHVTNSSRNSVKFWGLTTAEA